MLQPAERCEVYYLGAHKRQLDLFYLKAQINELAKIALAAGAVQTPVSPRAQAPNVVATEWLVLPPYISPLVTELDYREPVSTGIRYLRGLRRGTDLRGGPPTEHSEIQLYFHDGGTTEFTIMAAACCIAKYEGNILINDRRQLTGVEAQDALDSYTHTASQDLNLEGHTGRLLSLVDIRGGYLYNTLD